jgi:hypothetical protein
VREKRHGCRAANAARHQAQTAAHASQHGQKARHDNPATQDLANDSPPEDSEDDYREHQTWSNEGQHTQDELDVDEPPLEIRS